MEDVNTESAAEPPAETESSESVEWRDISVETGTPGGPESESDRLSGAESTTDTTKQQESAGGHVTDRIQAHAGEPLTIETGAVTATLLGVPCVRVDDLVYAHQHEKLRGNTRACALFDIENTGSGPIHWTSRRTKFIGSDGYTYSQAHVSLDPSQLGAGCYPRQVEIEPGCRARVITPVEQLPAAVDVAKVIHTVAAHGQPGSQRLTFTLK
jgi:hypothetical protein